MIVPIGNVLDAALLAEARAAFAAMPFEEGTRTAGWHARLVKKNEQTQGGSAQAEALKRRIGEALAANPVFRIAARPRRLSPLLLSRYRPGMEYGTHVDDALMGGTEPLRSDVSFTLFIAEPDSYEGGELVLESHAGEQSCKLPAGAAIIYPSNTLHRVAAVRAGERQVAVGWAQSLVRDPARREILFDLEQARHALFEQSGKSALFDTLSKTHANLLRMWAEP